MFLILFIDFVKYLNTIPNVMAILIYELEDSTTCRLSVHVLDTSIFSLTNSYAPVFVSSPYISGFKFVA